MESRYGIGINNRYALFLDSEDGEDDLIPKKPVAPAKTAAPEPVTKAGGKKGDDNKKDLNKPNAQNNRSAKDSGKPNNNREGTCMFSHFPWCPHGPGSFWQPNSVTLIFDLLSKFPRVVAVAAGHFEAETQIAISSAIVLRSCPTRSQRRPPPLTMRPSCYTCGRSSAWTHPRAFSILVFSVDLLPLSPRRRFLES